MHCTSRTLLAAGLLAGALFVRPGGASAQEARFLGKSLSKWIEQLEKSPKAGQRRSAAFALGRLGDDAALAIPELARRVRLDKEASVRDMAATALGEIVLDYQGEPFTLWGRIGTTLKKALGDRDPRVRRSAAYGLGALAKVTRAAADRERPHPRLRATPAGDALKKAAGEVGPALREALQDKSASVRQNAAWALGPLGPHLDGKAVADLCERLGDDDVLVRRDAAGALGKAGRKNGRAAARPLLERVKEEKDDVVRKTALEALTHVVGPEHRSSAAELAALLESKDEEVARGAALVLCQIGGEEARPAVPVLSKALADPDPAVQAVAAAGLERLGREAAPAVRALGDALADSKDPYVRRNCVLALAHIGPEARLVLPAIVAALKPVPGAPAPARNGRGRAYEEVREYAAEALSEIRFPANAAAMLAVCEAIRKDPNQVVRQRCIYAAWYVRDFKKYGLDSALEAILDETAFNRIIVRYEGARLLAHGLRERAPKKAATVMLEMLQNRELELYQGSAAAVGGIGGESTTGSSDVTSKYGGDARFLAAYALGMMGELSSGNPKIVQALKDAAKQDKDKRLSEAGKKALERLGVKE
jgi:HEAT repeat protein